ncbi:unnamed protein product [Cuscuta epithymum]|nr:unnamed protein product [Cuscuta epithymum]
MDSQDSFGFTNTTQPATFCMSPMNMNQFNPPSNYTVPLHSPNQFNPPAGYSIPPHSMNQFTPPVYHVDPKNGTIPFHMDQHNSQQFSYQELLNTPIVASQSPETIKASNKRAKNAKTSNTSQHSTPQPSILRKDWSIEEEVALTEAWLYISVDADVGNNQKNAAMWNRVLEVWKGKMGPDHNISRNNNSLQCHWHQIRGAVSKFVAKYEQLERRPQSGSNKDDLVIKALRLYEDFYGTPFKFLHCWEILIKNAKWCSQILTTAGASINKNSDNGTSPTLNECSTTMPEDLTPPKETDPDGIVRPQGRKNCKDKKRKLHEEKGVVDALNKLQSTLEKQVDVNRASMQMREQVLMKEIELKEKAQKLKEEGQRRQYQNRIMNQDLSKLSPSVRASYDVMQAKILKEWESDGLF